MGKSRQQGLYVDEMKIKLKMSLAFRTVLSALAPERLLVVNLLPLPSQRQPSWVFS
jgi:hypothetical protein